MHKVKGDRGIPRLPEDRDDDGCSWYGMYELMRRDWRGE
jgi:hypothetical protein